MRSGILSIGVYIPSLRLKTSEIANVWGKDNSVVASLGVLEKSVADLDEDSFTMGLESAFNAISKFNIEKNKIKRVFFGSESGAYAVKPTSVMIADYLGIKGEYLAYDTQFACKSATSALISAFESTFVNKDEFSLVIASDKALGKPSDALEFTAGSGAGSVVVGSSDNLLLELEGYASFATDTSDFWRKQHSKFPAHAGRFSGEPAYFYHIKSAVAILFKKIDLKVQDYDYVVFHTPNAKFPVKIALSLGFSLDQVTPSLIVSKIGNCYSASTFLSLSAVLQIVKPGDRILLVSYGSGAGSDAFSFKVSDFINEYESELDNYLNNKKYISYVDYLKAIGQL
ncbi:MAG: hydroxymethylglutaryl-CoA synthase [Patescibacteria group bacterium]|nr:MAG: hydroxymethylglutaryl-CoA synthase [Patescibacteria group bacterium]